MISWKSAIDLILNNIFYCIYTFIYTKGLNTIPYNLHIRGKILTLNTTVTTLNTMIRKHDSWVDNSNLSVSLSLSLSLHVNSSEIRVVLLSTEILKVIVPTILAFFKNCYKVAKLKDDIIKHRLNPIATIKTLVKHQLRVNKGRTHNGRVNNNVSVYQTKILKNS